MIKYINAGKLKAEIERRRLHFNKEAEKYQALNNGYSQNCYGARDALRDLENFLDSQPEEKPSEDLEEEIQKTIDKYPLNKEDMSEDDIATYHQGLIFGASHFAEWQKGQIMKEVKYGVVCKKGERDEEDVWIELNPGSLPVYKDTDPIDFIIVKQ